MDQESPKMESLKCLNPKPLHPKPEIRKLPRPGNKPRVIRSTKPRAFGQVPLRQGVAFGRSIDFLYEGQKGDVIGLVCI